MATYQQTGFVDTKVPVAPKRLIVCCDGTWQSSVTGLKNIPSNITRLARSIAKSGKHKNGKDVWQQVVYYDAGIGTGDLSNQEKDRQGGFGIGFLGNVIEAYNFLVLNYSPGNYIFCFGFSRGAYTARAVAGLVNDIGIISPNDMQDFPVLYKLYQDHKDSQGFRRSSAYRIWVNGVLSENQPPKVEEGFQEAPRYTSPPHFASAESSRVVQVVGVFDTVGSLGIPDLPWTRWNLKFLERWTGVPDVGFHNVSLSPYIRHAFHALAIDEHRKPFTPTLWHLPADDTIPKQPKDSHEVLLEKWSQLRSDKKAEEKDLSTAWGLLVDSEMHRQLESMSSDLKQVWFPGVHINIGGGSDDLLKENLEGDFEQISLITFAWMCEQIAPYIQLNGDLNSLAASSIQDRLNLINPVLEKVTKEKDYGSNWVTSKAWKLLDNTGLHKAHLRNYATEAVSGWATGPIVDSNTGTMALGGSEPRTPGRYQEGKIAETYSVIGDTNEWIHPCVEYRRQKNPSYKPLPLQNFIRTPKEGKDQAYEWKNGGVTIPEYLIKPEDVFTRLIAAQASDSQASNFIDGIDRAAGLTTQ